LRGTAVLVETAGGDPTPDSLGLLGLAAELGDEVRAVAFDHRAGDRSAELARHGATRLVILDHPAVAEGLAQPIAAALAGHLAEEPCETVLLGSSVLALDVAADLAARTGGGLNWDLVGLERDGDRLLGRRLMANDAIAVTVGWRALPQLALVRPGSCEPKEVGSPGELEVETVGVEPDESSRRVRLVERRPAPVAEDGGLAAAEIVVAGGRGLGEAGNFALLEELAGLLGGQVGATRAVVEAGWYPRQAQIGQTGLTVSPSLYVGFGISGAIHHKVGMQRAGTIVAVNTDRSAPIFDLCHLAVVGDALAILPELIGLLRDADPVDGGTGAPLE
jgi:electron transfer flavoprotein alpha subunit